MSAVPATKARRIGDILLELGFASEDALAKATVEQEKTGQPLGQILVDHGVITRLELASALAEQWSDQSASIKLLPIPPPTSAPRRAPEPHHDDDQYAARLQDAVAELAQRVGAGSAQPTEEFGDRVTDLAERVEATVARTQRIEATLATLAESFEGVTGGVEEAFGALQSGMAGLALDLARIDTTVAELVTVPAEEAPAADPAVVARLEEIDAAVAALAERPVLDPATESQLDELAGRVESLIEATETPDAALAARLDEIAAAVATVAERPVVDPEQVESRLDALAARVENVVTPDEVVVLHESLVAFEQRLAVLTEDAGSTAALDEQARSLAELRATVAELESRPVGDPELDERLAHIETQFAERLAAKPDVAEIEALAARLEASAGEHENLATALAQLGVRLDEMTWRDDGSASRLEELQEQVQALATALTDVREGLATQENAGARERLEDLGQSLVALREEVAALAQSVTPAGRIDEITQRVEDLTEREAQQALAARLEAVEGTLAADVVTPEHLARALADAREELSPTPAPLPDPRIDDLARELASLRDDQAPDPRVERLAEELAEVHARLAEVSTTPEPASDPAVHEQLEALAMRIEQLAGDRQDDGSLAAKLDDLERRFPTEADPRVEELSAELASLRQELADVREAPVPAADDAAVRDELDALTRRIDELPAAAPHDDGQLVAKIEAIEQRLEAPATADPRIDQLTQDIVAVRDELAKAERTPATDPVVASELDTLSQRLRFLDDRLNDDVATSSEVKRAIDALRTELATAGTPILTDTSELEATIGALVARVDGLTESVATGVPGTGAPEAGDLQSLVDERVEAQLAERLAELKLGLEERLTAAEAQPRAGGPVTGDSSGLEDLLERNRMTIERLGLHLGEHDRALAELMRSRNLPKKLDELAARVDEIAGGAPAAGTEAPGARREIGSFSAAEPSTGEVKALTRRVEDAEVASQADREKLMNRLERMASSIDWRLQRLEAAETAAASSDDD